MSSASVHNVPARYRSQRPDAPRVVAARAASWSAKSRSEASIGSCVKLETLVGTPVRLSAAMERSMRHSRDAVSGLKLAANAQHSPARYSACLLFVRHIRMCSVALTASRARRRRSRPGHGSFWGRLRRPLRRRQRAATACSGIGAVMCAPLALTVEIRRRRLSRARTSRPFADLSCPPPVSSTLPSARPHVRGNTAPGISHAIFLSSGRRLPCARPLRRHPLSRRPHRRDARRLPLPPRSCRGLRRAPLAPPRLLSAIMCCARLGLGLLGVRSPKKRKGVEFSA